jgi:hypothetical protein
MICGALEADKNEDIGSQNWPLDNQGCPSEGQSEGQLKNQILADRTVCAFFPKQLPKRPRRHRTLAFVLPKDLRR